MDRCQCITAKKKQCSREPMKKPNKSYPTLFNPKYCWQHQECINFIKPTKKKPQQKKETPALDKKKVPKIMAKPIQVSEQAKQIKEQPIEDKKKKPLKVKKEQSYVIKPGTGVPGLYYVPNFVTAKEAKQIIKTLLSHPDWKGVTASTKSRRVIQYGYTYSYQRGPLTSTQTIPDEYDFIQVRMLDLIKQHIDNDFTGFDQLIINEYLPGQGISGHIDHIKHFGPIIACLTLGSGIEMEFTHPKKESKSLYVAPNSLYIMSGKARYEWKHSITQRKSDYVNGQTIVRGTRYSLTFRKAISVYI